MLDRDSIVAALRTVHDPELPVNLYDLGLIYELEIGNDGRVRVVMTLTTPNCPVAEQMPEEVRRAVEGVAGVSAADVELVFDPPWTSDRMTEDAKLLLEMEGIEWADPRASVLANQKRAGLTIGRTGTPPPPPPSKDDA